MSTHSTSYVARRRCVAARSAFGSPTTASIWRLPSLSSEPVSIGFVAGVYR
jgi:hypothetical protein